MKKRLILIPLLTLVLIVALVTAVAGCAGEPGLRGSQGEQGIQGEQGEPGPAGSQGEPGPLGPQGEQGATGSKGATGSTGAVGEQGEQGERGLTGAGTKGATGATGAKGAAGATGSAGPQGEQGETGATGPQGSAGSTVAPRFSVSLGVKNTGQASAMLFTSPISSGTYSIRLKTLSGVGEEARIVITPLTLITLSEITSISWSAYTASGYPPHVDISLDIDGDGVADESLNVEYAYNLMSHYSENGGLMPYGAVYGTWFQTFNDDSNGPTSVNDTCYAWLNSGAPGPPGGAFGDGGHYGDALMSWKYGLSIPSGIIDGDALVTKIEIEVDNWVLQTEAFVDDIAINGVLIWQ